MMMLSQSIGYTYAICIALGLNLVTASPIQDPHSQTSQPQSVDPRRPQQDIVDPVGDRNIEIHLSYWHDSPENYQAITNLMGRAAVLVDRKLKAGGDLTVPGVPQTINLAEGYRLSFARDSRVSPAAFQYKRLSAVLHALLTWMGYYHRFQHLEAVVYSIDPLAHELPFGVIKIVPDDVAVEAGAQDVTGQASGIDPDPLATLLKLASAEVPRDNQALEVF